MLSERRSAIVKLTMLLLALALAGAMFLGGCKSGDETTATGTAATATADGTATGEAGAATGAGAQTGGGGGMGGGMRGGGMRGGGMRGGGMGGGMAAAGTGAAGAGAGGATGPAAVTISENVVLAKTLADVKISTKGAETGIPEVDKMKKIRDFAAVFGPTTIIKAEDVNGTPLEWIAVTPKEGKVRSQVVMPVSMVEGAALPEILEGYFPIYVRGGRPLGKTISKELVTAPSRPKKSSKEIKEAIQKSRPAAAAEATGEVGGAAAAGAGGGMRGGGMRGGGGGMGGGGMRGGGMRGGGMRGGGMRGGGMRGGGGA